jgi:hypothetical protein
MSQPCATVRLAMAVPLLKQKCYARPRFFFIYWLYQENRVCHSKQSDTFPSITNFVNPFSIPFRWCARGKNPPGSGIGSFPFQISPRIVHYKDFAHHAMVMGSILRYRCQFCSSTFYFGLPFFRILLAPHLVRLAQRWGYIGSCDRQSLLRIEPTSRGTTTAKTDF